MQEQPPITVKTQNQPLSQPMQGPVISQPIPPPPQPSMRLASPESTPRHLPLDASFPSEETSLSRILQSLLQDIPTNSGSTFSPMRVSTPDYVPPRATPPSKAMVISRKKPEGRWADQGRPSTSKPPPNIPTPPPLNPASPPPPPPPARKRA